MHIYNYRRGASRDFYSTCSNASKEAPENPQGDQTSHHKNWPRYFLYVLQKLFICVLLVIADCRFGLALEAHVGDCSAKVQFKKTPTRPSALQLRAIRASPARKALDFTRDDRQEVSPARPIAARTLPIITEVDEEEKPAILPGTFNI